MLPTVATTQVAEISQNEKVISAAVQLRRMGLNVFPVMRPQMVRALFPDGANKKRPYEVKPIHNTRLHLHADKCFDIEEMSGKRLPCFRPHIHFESLFRFSNLALMLGVLSGNMVCLDCDTKKAYVETVNQFVKKDFDYWSHHTSRGGHLYFRCLDGEVENNKQCGIPGVEVLGHRKYSVLPPSIHPNGDFYMWKSSGEDGWIPPESLPEPISINNLDWLGITLRRTQHKIPDLYGLPSSAMWLSDSNRRILVNGAVEGTRNIQLSKVAYDIAANVNRDDISEEEGWDLLVIGAKNCEPPFPEHELTSIYESVFRRDSLLPAREYYGKKLTKRINIVPLLNWAVRFDWSQKGLSCRTDRFVFYALLFRLWKDNDLDFRASVREIAEIANIQQPKTVSQSIQRMKSKGLIETTSVNDYGVKRYRIGSHIPVNLYYSNTPTLKNTVVEISSYFEQVLPMSDEDRDVFVKCNNAYYVWKRLVSKGWMSSLEIKDAIDLPRRTTKNNIEKLVQLGYVEESPAEGLYRALELIPDEKICVARKLGTEGNSHYRKLRFQVERELYANRKMYECQQKYLTQYEERSEKRND